MENPPSEPRARTAAVSMPRQDTARGLGPVFQRCRSCGSLQWPVQTHCRSCAGDDPQEVTSSGIGRVCVLGAPCWKPAEASEVDLPQPVALVDLLEGCRVVAALVGVAPQDLRTGLLVEAAFGAVDAQCPLPRFGPAMDHGSATRGRHRAELEIGRSSPTLGIGD